MAIPVKTISDFKSALAGGGARPNLFEVTIDDFPSVVSDAWNNDLQSELQFMCKATSLPASTVAEVPVPFRGRILKVAGDRTFADWTITVINDEDFLLRTAFEKWMNAMSNLVDGTGATNPSSYMSDAFVKQLGRSKVGNQTAQDFGESSVLRSYRFYDIFPTEVSAIDLCYETTDTIEQFDVTFQMQYFTVSGNTRNADGAVQNPPAWATPG